MLKEISIGLQPVALYWADNMNRLRGNGWSADLYRNEACVDVFEAPTKIEALCMLFTAYPDLLERLSDLEFYDA